MPTDTNKKGFTLVVSVMIVSVILALIAVASVQHILFLRKGGTAYEDEFNARMLAEGCAEQALLKFRQNQAYRGDEILTLNGNPCTIRPILGNGPFTFETEATINTRVSRYQIKIADTETFQITQWKPVSGF